MWYLYTIGYYSDMKNCHWNSEILKMVPTRMNFGGSYTKWSQPQRKKITGDVSFRQSLKKETEEVVYNIKRDSENQKTKN